MRNCQQCGEPLPENAHHNRKFCVECAYQRLLASNRRGQRAHPEWRIRDREKENAGNRKRYAAMSVENRRALYEYQRDARTPAQSERRKAHMRGRLDRERAKNIPCSIVACDNLATERMSSDEPICSTCYQRFLRTGSYCRRERA